MHFKELLWLKVYGDQNYRNRKCPPEDCYPAIEEEWHFTKLWIATEDDWIRCDAMLPFIDQNRIIDEVKESWRE